MGCGESSLAYPNVARIYLLVIANQGAGVTAEPEFDRRQNVPAVLDKIPKPLIGRLQGSAWGYFSGLFRFVPVRTVGLVWRMICRLILPA